MIELIPFYIEDFPNLIDWIDNKNDLIQFSGGIFTFPLNNSQLEFYLRDSKRHAFKVVSIENGITIGHSEIYLTNNKCAKLCRILIGDSLFRGKGIGQIIVNELVKMSFEKYKVEKIELNVYDWNTSAIKCYEKVGFEIQKGITKTIEINNTTWTAINMLLVKSDWKVKV